MSNEAKAQAANEIKQLLLGVGEKGKSQIIKTLSESNDAYKSIIQLQEGWSLGYPRCLPAISFLDVLKCQRADVYKSLFESMKSKLDEQLDRLDDTNLLVMLKETIHFMAMRDLKSLPISIIKRLKSVPDLYLNHLAKKNFLSVKLL